jgi:AcrR family transcriptional regulator
MADATRDQILAAATRLMAAHGVAGTSIQDVADAVNLRKASILYHFPSKDALRKAVIDALLTRWRDVLPRLLLAGEMGPEARLDAVMSEFITFFSADTDRARLLVRELLDRPAELEPYLVETIGPWLRVIALALDAGKSRGLVRADADLRNLPVLLGTLVLSAIAAWDSLGFMAREPGDGADQARTRYHGELMRIARAALFPDTAPAPLRDLTP